jgi:hypothetical protein
MLGEMSAMTSATSYQFVLIVVLRADKRYDINFGHKSRNMIQAGRLSNEDAL